MYRSSLRRRGVGKILDWGQSIFSSREMMSIGPLQARNATFSTFRHLRYSNILAIFFAVFLLDIFRSAISSTCDIFDMCSVCDNCDISYYICLGYVGLLLFTFISEFGIVYVVAPTLLLSYLNLGRTTEFSSHHHSHRLAQR